MHHEECKTVARQECKTVEKAFTVQEPVQDCADRLEEVCVPAPRQKCTTVHDEVPRLVSYRNFLTNHDIKSRYRIAYTHRYQEKNHFYKKNCGLTCLIYYDLLKIQFTAGNPDFNLLFLFTSVILYYLVIYLFDFNLHFLFTAVILFIYLSIYLCRNVIFLSLSQVPRQVCKDVAREECAQVPREITTYRTEQECSTHTQKQCKPAQKTVCDGTVTTR